VLLNIYKKYLFFDLSLYVFVLALIMILRADIGIIISFVLLVLSILYTKRYNLFKFLSISFVLAFIWQLIGGSEYFYGENFIILLGINLFPLFAWTIGLFIAYVLFFYAYGVIHKKIEKNKPIDNDINNKNNNEYNYSNRNNLSKLFLFAISFILLLILIETLAYHVFEFKNLGGAEYVGLPICDCIHSPPWMQTVYLFFGPIFIIIIYLMRNVSFGNNETNSKDDAKIKGKKVNRNYELFN